MAATDIIPMLERRLREAKERLDMARGAFELTNRLGRAPRGTSKKAVREQMLMAEAAWEELRNTLEEARRVNLR